MTYFEYKNQELFVENVAVSRIAKEVGTPFYCYSKTALIDNYQNFTNAFKGIDHKICYAIKANSNLNIVKIFS